MVRIIPQEFVDQYSRSSIPLAIGLFVSVTALVALCAQHGRRKKYQPEKISSRVDMAPKSPARQILTAITNKSPFKKRSGGSGDDESTRSESGFEFDHRQGKGGGDHDQEGFGEGGLWQKSILMGEKCRPAEFSGVIHYDSRGNQLSEPPPRSPRASPLPSFSSNSNAYS